MNTSQFTHTTVSHAFAVEIVDVGVVCVVVGVAVGVAVGTGAGVGLAGTLGLVVGAGVVTGATGVVDVVIHLACFVASIRDKLGLLAMSLSRSAIHVCVAIL